LLSHKLISCTFLSENFIVYFEFGMIVLLGGSRSSLTLRLYMQDI
jgi:hypothetical protein